MPESMIFHHQHDQDLTTKQARIGHEQAKEELKPFLTNLGTHMRATAFLGIRGSLFCVMWGQD